jgi:hypothetical protein
MIPGFPIAWVTFPGVIFHEYAHKRACEWRGVPVIDVQYFSFSGGGYVQHGRPRNHVDTIAINIAPLAMNTLLAVVLYVVAFLLFGLAQAGDTITIIGGVVGWMGLSTAWHTFPSRVDTGNIWRAARQEWRHSAVAFLSLPFVPLLYLANLLSFFWFDATMRWRWARRQGQPCRGLALRCDCIVTAQRSARGFEISP